MTHPSKALGALLAIALVLGGCSSDSSDTAGEPGDAPASSEQADEITEQVVVGAATVTVNATTWDFDVTSCVVADGRVTAQGDAREGRTLVASFTQESPSGSVTVTGPDDIWAAGPAGGTIIDDIEVSEDVITGRGTFGRRLVQEPDEEGDVDQIATPQEDRTEDGSFEVSCTEQS